MTTARGWQALAAIAAAALVVLVLAPAVGGGFIFDDFTNIVTNTGLHLKSLDGRALSAAAFSSPSSDLQRPVAMLTLALNTYFTGLDPVPMKWTNISIHLLNTSLVFRLALLLSRWVLRDDLERRALAARMAGFVALAWAVNPINFTAVMYVIQRMESLCHLFVFAGLILYVQGRIAQREGRSGWAWILGGLLGGTVLGLGAKESAVLLPLYAFTIEYLLFRATSAVKERTRLDTLFAALLWIPAVVGGAWVLSVSLRPAAYSGRTYTLVERLLTEPRVLVDYLHWTFIPDVSSMGLYHDGYVVSRGLLDPPATLWSLAALAALLCVAWAVRKRFALAATGVLLFIGAHALTGTFLSLDLMYEHRNYFASFGLMLVLADILFAAPKHDRGRRLGHTLALVALATYAFSTWSRSEQWSDPLVFARSEALRHPESPRAQYDLARILVLMSRYEPKSPHWQPAKAAIAHARTVGSASILPAQAALMFNERSGQPEDPSAWEELEDRLHHQPIGPEALGALAAMTRCATSKLCKFPPERMLKVFSAALGQGDNPELLNIYGSYALMGLHDVALCERLWQEAARLRPAEPQYRANLARLHIAARRWSVAESDIETLQRIGRIGQNEALAATISAELSKARVAAASAASGSTAP